jgi:drug/metabolite transporter (DMT)-like permease
MVKPKMGLRIKADLMLLACAVVWGFAFLFQKTAMEHIGPLAFIAARSILALMVLGPLAWREWQRRRTAVDRSQLIKWSVLAGLAFFGGAVFQQVGIVTASVTNTGFLTALYVVLTPLIAWLLCRRRPTFWVWIGVGLGATGTWLLGGGRALEGFGFGDAMVAISAVFWAFYVVVVGLASSLRVATTFTAIQFLVVAGLALIGVVLFEDVTMMGLWRAGPDLFFVGVLSSALMFTLFAAAMQQTEATETAVIASLESLFAALAAWLFLNERLQPLGWVGATFLLVATVVVHLPARPKTFRQARQGEAADQ